MPYITREDGVHFVVPSYRDVLTARQKSQLKKDILALSQSYGGYITLQRKGGTQYEIAFSPDTGYLLGESVWNYFKRPVDMVYCEAIPNTSEAILVIVKGGSVYLDGSFPIENISEELVIFLTQENNFEIYIYGDVPISQTPADGKFSFEASSVKTFTVLDKPVFPTLPLLKIYQLQLVDAVLRAYGIGVFPLVPVLLLIILLGGGGYLLWEFVLKPPPPPPPPPPEVVNPYLTYNRILMTPDPVEEMNAFLSSLNTLLTIPSWDLTQVRYSGGDITATVTTVGSSVQQLIAWSKANDVSVEMRPDGIHLDMPVKLPANRPAPKDIYPLTDVIARFVDHLSAVYPGNHLQLSEIANKGKYNDVTIIISVDKISPATFALIGEQMKDLPFVLKTVALTVNNGMLTGSINFEAVGS